MDIKSTNFWKNAIIGYRINNNLTREQFAKMAKIHKNTVANIETGKHTEVYDSTIIALVRLIYGNYENFQKTVDNVKE